MARQYITKLLPAFTSLFLQQAMQPNMRKAALTLVRKMVHFTPPDLLLQLTVKQGAEKEDNVDRYPECSPLAVQLVQVIAAVLDNEVRAAKFLAVECFYRNVLKEWSSFA